MYIQFLSEFEEEAGGSKERVKYSGPLRPITFSS
jgi:hypothetical protein